MGRRPWHTKIVNDYKEILKDPEIDAVLICSSTNTHSQISIEAAEAGKHIFVKNPSTMIWTELTPFSKQLKKQALNSRLVQQKI